MPSDRSAREIERLERAFWQSIVDSDAPTATRMLTEPALMVSGHGAHRFDHAEYARMLDNEGMRLVDYDIGKIDVLFPTEDVAVATYDVEQTVETQGKRNTMQAHDSSTWVRMDGDWRCVAHTESLAPRQGAS